MGFTEGRQNSGYSKLKLFAFSRCDCYILKFPKGSRVPGHTDPVFTEHPGYGHHRLNLVLLKAIESGEFWSRYPVARAGRFIVFRPDVNIHGVSKIRKGSRWVLSIGWLRKNNGNF